MTPKIYHETIDKRFIDYLDSIGYEEFENLFDTTTLKKQSKEIYIDYYFDREFDLLFPCTMGAMYKLEVMFEIEFDSGFQVSKDHEFNMTNLKKNETISCNPYCHDFNVIARSNNYKGLQELFDRWLIGYYNWKNLE